MDEEDLKRKLRGIENLFERATTPGERAAADHARRQLRSRLHDAQAADPPLPFRFSLPDPWKRKLFLALLRRYELRPYRHRGQRYSTVMVNAPKGFVDRELWPQYLQLADTLEDYLDDVTSRVIAETIHGDTSDPAEVDAPEKLQSGS